MESNIVGSVLGSSAISVACLTGRMVAKAV